MGPNNNIDPGGPLKWPQLKWAPNNNIDLEGLGPVNLIFTYQFKWAPYNNIDPGARALLI